MIVVVNTDKTTFLGKHPMKKLWRKGLMPSVKRGIYGDELTQDNFSIEHLKARSKGGKNGYDNVAFSSKAKNNLRGDKDIRGFLTKEMVDKYCEQFKGIRIGRVFNGDLYTQLIKRTLRVLGVYR